MEVGLRFCVEVYVFVPGNWEELTNESKHSSPRDSREQGALATCGTKK